MKTQTRPKNVISIDAGSTCIQCGRSGRTQNYFCLDCSGEMTRFKVPTPNEFFDEEAGREVDFLLAPELERIGRNLIRTYEEDFEQILEAEIDYFWKKKGGASGGRSTLGKCKKVSGELKYYSKKDFLIWLGADNCWSLNYYQITALVFHELKHGSYNPSNGKYELLGHELEIFNREVEVFGFWKNDITLSAKAFEKAFQPKLF